MQGAGLAFQLAPSGMAFDEVARLPQMHWVVGAALSLVSLAVLLLGLWHLDCMLRQARGPQIFSLANIAHLRLFAGAGALSTLLSIAEVPMRGLLFKYILGASGAVIKMAVTSSDLFLVLLCVVFYLVADMMHAARRLAQENEAFV